MSIPAIRPTATGSANPLHINLSAPPVGTRTTITLERNTATSGVAVTTESTLISDVQEDAPGIIGCCMGYVKRTWTSICNWFLYVFHFFFPPSALSAITQVEQNLERANHEQRRWMEERQREIVQMLQTGRPGEPPAVGAVTTATGSTTPPAAAPSLIPRPTLASLQLANEQRGRLVAALVKLERINASIASATDDQIGTQHRNYWITAGALKQDYRDTTARIDDCLRSLNNLSQYSQEGEEDKGGPRTPVREVDEMLSIERHTLNLCNFVNPPSYASLSTSAVTTPPPGSGTPTTTDSAHN
ncbi:MAG TPA: hypothetical protein VIJ46_01655 [Rhabdochlamydiaceae bacterium]